MARGLVPASDETLYLSVIAGIRLTDMCRWLGGKATIVRAMPNTAVSIRESMTCLAGMPDSAEAIAVARDSLQRTQHRASELVREF